MTTAAPSWALLKRDRLVIVAALLAISALAWFEVVRRARQMTGSLAMSGMADMSPASMSMLAPALGSWTDAHFLTMFTMWVVMMVAMMTPTITPVVIVHAQLSRQALQLREPFTATAWFVCGYCAAWTLFSIVATLAQWGLDSLALITPMMASSSRRFGGAVLITAGIYQWLPLKNACLAQCRSPLFFIQQHGGFRADVPGALRIGCLHGLYCIGCCWALMALLFVGGVMNLLWIAAITIFVLLEKLLPHVRALSRLAGLMAITAGTYLAAL